MFTIGIIGPQVSLEAINNAIASQGFSYIFFRYVYETLEEIPKIYQRCKDKCDIILFSGEFGYYYAIKHIKNLTVPCDFISYTEAQVLTILLNATILHPDIPLNRMYVDFLDFLVSGNGYLKLEKTLPPGHIPYFFHGTDCNYESLIEQPKALYEQHKIDLVLTASTNNIPAFGAFGIPYMHILPTEEMVAESICNAINNHRLAIGAISYKVAIILKLIISAEIPSCDREYIEVSCHKLLVDFRREQNCDFVITNSMDRFELYVETAFKRDRYRLPQSLITYLEQNRMFTYRMGVGIGDALDKSRGFAEKALFEAVRYGKNDGFAIEDESDILIGPLSSPILSCYSYSSSKAMDFSCKNGINESNLFRIVDLFEMNPQVEITSAALASWLKITVQSSNRILVKLLDSRLIDEISQEAHMSRGRPFRKYHFNVKNCERVFW